MVKDRVRACAVTSLDVNTLAGAYAAINSDGLDGACFLLRIINDSNKNLEISYDGVTCHEFIDSDDQVQLDFQLNSLPNNRKALMEKGTVVYAKATAGGIGYVYLVGYYLD